MSNAIAVEHLKFWNDSVKTAKHNAKSTTRVQLQVACELRNSLEIWIQERGFEHKIPNDNNAQSMFESIAAEGRELIMASSYIWLRQFRSQQEVATQRLSPISKDRFGYQTTWENKWHPAGYPRALRRPNYPADFKLFEHTAQILHTNFGLRFAKTDPISTAHLLG